MLLKIATVKCAELKYETACIAGLVVLGAAVLPSLKKRWQQRLLFFFLLVPLGAVLFNHFLHLFDRKMGGGYPYNYWVSFRTVSALSRRYLGVRLPRMLLELM